ncbi:hypothetical protein AX16_001135, partial [Volvariella volvacea WC 439]
MKLEEVFVFDAIEYREKLKHPDYDTYKLLANIKQKERTLRDTGDGRLPHPLTVLVTGGF